VRFVVELTPAAQRQLRRLDRLVRRRVAARIDKLSSDPRPPGVTRLQATARLPLYRVRVGDYRIIYLVEDEKLLVIIIRIGHRSEVYS
jgi:mRNA interferase RelE/StbE